MKCYVSVTGGAGTLALVNARALLEHGLSGLVLFDRELLHRSTEIERLREDFPASRILTKRVDVTDVGQVGSAVDETVEELGSVDILCCLAGVVNCAHALELTAEDWKRTLDINTTGAFLCAQAVARYSSPSLSTEFLSFTYLPIGNKSLSRSLAALCLLPPSRLIAPITRSRKPATMRRKRRYCP